MVLLKEREGSRPWDHDNKKWDEPNAKWLAKLTPLFWVYTIMLAFNLTYYSYYNFLFLNSCFQDLSRRSFITKMLGDFL